MPLRWLSMRRSAEVCEFTDVIRCKNDIDMKHIYNLTGRSLLYISLLTAVTAFAAGCDRKKDKNAAQHEVPAIQVAEATVDSVVLYKTLPGIIQSATTTNVVARVNGKVLSKNFTGGDYVRSGQTLYTIESTTYRNAVESAQASLASARSQYDYYTKQLAAMRKALEADAVSKMQVSQAENNLQQAASSISEAQAQLSTARENLSHCTVTAPSSGYISETRIDAGNYVSGEGEAVVLATIYDNDNLRAEFSISDSQYEELIGGMGGITAQVYRDVPLSFREPLQNGYTADLYYESPSIDQSTGSLSLVGTLTNKDNELKNGMYVTVSLPYDVNPRAVLVKDASLGSDQLGYYLYTVDSDNKVHHTPVKVGGVYQDSLRVVTSGIEPGQRYVTKALLNVRPGETIRPVMTK